MDFFASQDQARRNTRWLVFLFVLAIAGIILVLWAAACAVLADTRSPSVPSWRPDILAVVTVFTLSVVFAGSAYKIWELRAGGQQIARYLGGRPVLPNTTDLAERRLLNVVEEMALAAGLSPPPVFVLDEEESINAFAAGYSPDDAVIGVNRGTLLYLTRDELQGVIAHEFSHILNGDMRLNLRLVGLLHGILVLSLIGRQLLMASRRGRRRADAVLFVGIVLFIVGLIGLFLRG
ncbi:MAG: hypothetical protein KatS3mg110_3876 [Pirellulaceae bacterium]|nr:MAG: hypothetical protein KatS3mg110_3876 [Pirellulaceae bacterium]